jgi:hypothetical protein
MTTNWLRNLGLGVLATVAAVGVSNSAMADHYYHGYGCSPYRGTPVYAYRPVIVQPYNNNYYGRNFSSGFGTYSGFGYNNFGPSYGGYGVGGFPTYGSFGGGAFPRGGSFGGGAFPSGGSFGGGAFPSGGSFGGGAFPRGGYYGGGSGFSPFMGR